MGEFWRDLEGIWWLWRGFNALLEEFGWNLMHFREVVEFGGVLEGLGRNLVDFRGSWRDFG